MLLLLAVLGCRPAELDYLSDVEIRRAELEGLTVQTMAVLGGATYGGGDLVIEAMDGSEYIVPVDVRGGTAGLGVDLLPLGAVGRALLELPDRRVMGNELFGRYKGSSQSIVAGAGVEVRHLRNPYGVIIDEPAFGLGVGLMVGYEWLSVWPKIPEESLGAFVIDTGDTGDAGAR